MQRENMTVAKATKGAVTVLGAVAAVMMASSPAAFAQGREAGVAGPTTGSPTRNLRESDPAPAGAAATTAAAPGGADGGAGGYGKVGNPYSQAGYGAGAFGNGRPSPK